MKTKVVPLNLPPPTERSASTFTTSLTRVPEIRGPANQPGKVLAPTTRRGRARLHSSQHIQPRASLLINDNHCVKFLISRILVGSKKTLNCAQYLEARPESRQIVNLANLNVVSHAHFVHGQRQKNGISPATVKQNLKLKCVNNVSSVDQLCCVNLAPNVTNVVQNIPIGARLNQFWETLGVGPKVVQMLKEGYTLPFQSIPNLTRSPTITSCYVNSHRNLCLLDALHQLTNKNAIELVKNQESRGFYNRLFLFPKPNNKWRPILDLSNLNKFLKVEKFKMETPEMIQTSQQTGEWVTSIDFKDAYFNIPIQTQSRKYLRFHVQGKTYQSTTLWSVHSSTGVHGCGQRGQTDGSTEGYKNPPVPGRLVGPSQIPDFRLCRLPVRPAGGQGQTHRRPVADTKNKNHRSINWTDLSGPAANVPYRVINSNRKAGPPRLTPHETHTMAPKTKLEGPRITRKGSTSPQVDPPPFKMVAGGRQCAPRSTITPYKTCSPIVYRPIKRRLGRSLKRSH